MNKALRQNLIVAAWAVAFFAFLCFVLVQSAIAHMAQSGWAYPIECCSGHDCEVLDSKRVHTTAGGWLVDDKFFVAYAMARKSPDGEFHGCFPTKQAIGCFWAPPQGS